MLAKKLYMCLDAYFNKRGRKDKLEIGEQMCEEKIVTVKFEKPIATGMSLALGFFLMSLVLSLVGYLVLGLSCAAMLT